MTRDETFPEQIDTWICSSGTLFFFVPSNLNRDHLIRHGYPENDIYTVGNSVVDALYLKRNNEPKESVFNIYLILESGNWIRMDIHGRENLTFHRFNAIIGGLIDLITKNEFKVILIFLNATISALNKYNLYPKLKNFEEKYSEKLILTNLWKEYGRVVKFLDSGKCWIEVTDSINARRNIILS
ncbi:MAG: UDP-N-acetylglucosamine 2-epimerase [Candidatus Nitrosocosmicus sp.]